METKQLEHGLDGIREAHPSRQLQNTWNMDKINCLWRLFCVTHWVITIHSEESDIILQPDKWHKKWQTTFCDSSHKKERKNPNSVTGTLFSIYRMLLQVHDFELGPPEKPHSISHGHHWHTYDQSWRIINFWHSSSCTLTTAIQGIPFLIPCQFAALILLAFFKAHVDEGFSERRTNLGW